MSNLSKKYTFPLFESCCILNGILQNPEFHSGRFLASFQKFYGKKPTYGLYDDIDLPLEYQSGRVKLRISYGKDDKQHTLHHYEKQRVERLRLIYDNGIDYELKFEDRSDLNQLYTKKGNCDDILIIKNRCVTDTSYANIAFFNGAKWFTPSTFLLAGTKRAALLKARQIEPVHITLDNLYDYRGYQLLNALLDFDPKTYIPIQNIIK